jgi:hypothetical protein
VRSVRLVRSGRNRPTVPPLIVPPLTVPWPSEATSGAKTQLWGVCATLCGCVLPVCSLASRAGLLRSFPWLARVQGADPDLTMFARKS